VPYDAAPEFDRQLGTLLDLGYPALAGLSDRDFTALLEPLRGPLLARAGELPAPTPERVPFVLVVTAKLAPTDAAVALTRLAGRTKPGEISRHLPDLDRFGPIPAVEPPAADAYAVLDVERGAEFCDVRPADALPVLTGRDRTPLTVDEGVALATQFPAALEKNKCFSLAGSRAGDQRVPALWISAGAPMLGWCWAGNPHSWLGVASCGGRVGAPRPTG
jgi:hypothetical protein